MLPTKHHHHHLAAAAAATAPVRRILMPLLLLIAISITSLINFDLLCSSNKGNNNSWGNYNNIIDHITSNNNNKFVTAPHPFDQAVQLSYNLINPTVPSSSTSREKQPARQPPYDKKKKRVEPRTPPFDFDVNDWDTRTEGGLQDLDRILLAELYGAAYSVFEYGLGESTYIANAMQVPRYSGIDSDAVWVTMARQNVSSQFRFYFADIGTTKIWGHPTDPTLPKNILHYQLLPLIVEDQPFDIYMSDGRWRIPCMIVSFLHASARGADPSETTVLLHDCFIREHWDTAKIGSHFPNGKKWVRPAYHTADHLVDLVRHSGDRLCVYRRKPTTTDMDLYEFWKDNYNLID